MRRFGGWCAIYVLGWVGIGAATYTFEWWMGWVKV